MYEFPVYVYMYVCTNVYSKITVCYDRPLRSYLVVFCSFGLNSLNIQFPLWHILISIEEWYLGLQYSMFTQKLQEYFYEYCTNHVALIFDVQTEIIPLFKACFLCLGTIGFLSQVVLCCWGVVLCIVRCLAASLTSTLQMPTAPHPQPPSIQCDNQQCLQTFQVSLEGKVGTITPI